MTCHPKEGRGELIPVVDRVTPWIEALGGGKAGSRGTGGMATKVRAAKFSTAHGVPVVIASGRNPELLSRIVAGQSEGTLFKPCRKPRKIGKLADLLTRC